MPNIDRPIVTLAAWIFLLGLGAGVGAASGATIEVTTLATDFADDGECNLGEAIYASSADTAFNGCPAGDGHDTILIPLKGSISLPSRMAWIAEDLTIVGSGNLTIFGPGDWYTFQVLGANTVEIRDLDVGFARGVLLAEGGSDVTLRRINASFTFASGRNGGAVTMAGGSLLVEDCTFAYNEAQWKDGVGGRGGAIYAGAPTTIRRSEFIGNKAHSGGAVEVLHHDLTIHHSVFTDNTSTLSGGAVSYFSATAGKKATITSTLFKSNEGDGGGAIQLGGGGEPEVWVDSSTFDRNRALGSAGRGGAIQLDYLAELTVTNSTFDRNSGANGGAIGANTFSQLYVSHSTLTDNTGAGGTLWSNIGGDLSGSLESSIVWGNVACVGATLRTSGYNLLPDDSCNLGNQDVVGLDPMLGPLADNGGPVPTRYPASASPAVDTGSPVDPEWGMECLTFDARGLERPYHGDGRPGGTCDRGAVERTPTDLLHDGFESGDTSAW